jgi:hypothetical protein
MSIIVACPGCRKSFKVSDQFAGRTGACPNCKRPLRVPTKAEEVKIQAPEEFAGGGRSKTGKLITKPIERTNAKFQPVTTTIIAAASLLVLLLAWAGRHAHLFESNNIFTIIGLLVISPPLALAAYEVVRDDEFEPYRGMALYLRTSLCALGYAALWGIFFGFVTPMLTGELWNWIFVAPPFVVVGGLAAVAAFDMEFGTAALHYGFYLVATLLLGWVAGIQVHCGAAA